MFLHMEDRTGHVSDHTVFVLQSVKGKVMTADESPQAVVNEMFSQAAQFFQNAVTAGISFQQNSTKALTELITGLSSPQQWQQQFQTTMPQMMATMEKNMDDAIELMTKNSKTSLELLEKAFEAKQAAAQGDGEASAREMWETALGSFLRNAEVMVQANNRMLDSWRQMAKALQDAPPEEKSQDA